MEYYFTLTTEIPTWQLHTIIVGLGIVIMLHLFR